MVKVYLQLIVKIRNWKKAILLTRFVFSAGAAMAAPEAGISCAINSLPWAVPMVAMVAAAPISY